MSDEMKEDLAARNAAAEKAMGDAIQVLEGAIELGAGLSEEDRRVLYAARFGVVRQILREFIRRSPVAILAQNHGVHLRRYADDSRVRLIGVREFGGVKKIWEIDVDKVEHGARIAEGDDVLMSVAGHKNRDVEQTAIRGMLQILNERIRCSSHERSARKAAKTAQEAK